MNTTTPHTISAGRSTKVMVVHLVDGDVKDDQMWQQTVCGRTLSQGIIDYPNLHDHLPQCTKCFEGAK